MYGGRSKAGIQGRETLRDEAYVCGWNRSLNTLPCRHIPVYPVHIRCSPLVTPSGKVVSLRRMNAAEDEVNLAPAGAMYADSRSIE